MLVPSCSKQELSMKNKESLMRERLLHFFQLTIQDDVFHSHSLCWMVLERNKIKSIHLILLVANYIFASYVTTCICVCVSCPNIIFLAQKQYLLLMIVFLMFIFT